MKGLRFERIGTNRYYNVVFHMGSSYIPVSDETVEELKAQSLLPVERFLDLLVSRICRRRENGARAGGLPLFVPARPALRRVLNFPTW